MPTTEIDRPRTGPIIDRDCGACEGVGEPDCPVCKGNGRIPVKIHPFGTLEALHEHLGSLRSYYKVARTEKFKPPIGSPAYHLNAAEDYASSLLQQLIVMLPEEWERTEGD